MWEVTVCKKSGKHRWNTYVVECKTEQEARAKVLPLLPDGWRIYSVEEITNAPKYQALFG